MKQANELEIEGKKVAVSNLDKVFFPATGQTKGDLIEYYIRMSQYILPYLKDRPFSMLHFPDGVTGKSFYQKQKPKDAPPWLQSVTLPSGDKTIDWCLVNDLPSLIYIVNRACIETHSWFSHLPNLAKPDITVFDIDPSGNTGFKEAVSAALLVKVALDTFGLKSYPKVSGKLGIHVYVPIEPETYETVRAFLSSICSSISKVNPDLCTTERSIAKRGNRVYLDAVQNAPGKTLPSPYSIRATESATVSAPVTWDEINSNISPEDFNIKNIEGRVNKKGDLFAAVYTLRQKLPKLS